MAQQTIPVTPGQVATVNVNLANGATLYNGDANNAVWVSSDPGVSAGNGMRIGPKGSVTWAQSGPCYACVDTGVTASLTLTVSTDVQNLVNPVDIGVAVASQLLAKGVPNVLVGQTLFSGILPTQGASQGWEVPGGVGAYASLTVAFTAPTNCTVTAAFLNESGQTVSSTTYSMAAGPQDQNALQIQLKVRTGRLMFYFSSGTNNVSMQIYGSNRDAQDAIMNGTMPTVYNFGNSYTAYTNVFIPTGYISNGKQTFMRAVVTNQASNWGYFGCRYTDKLGNVATIDLVDSKIAPVGSDGAQIEKFLEFPPGCLGIYFRPYTTGNYTAVITLTPTA